MMMADVRSDIRQVIDDNRKGILALLEELVNCNSYSHNKAGVDEVGKMAAREMPGRFARQVVKSESLGDHHVYSNIREGIRGASAIDCWRVVLN